MAGELFELYLANLGVLVVFMSFAAVPSFRTKDPSYVDAVWGLGFVVVAVVSATVGDASAVRTATLVGLAAVWGIRLATYLFARWRREGPDPRYRRMLGAQPRNAVIWLRVFMLQAVVLSVVSLPLQVGQHASTPSGLTPLNIAGVLLAVFGIAFESIADAQLRRFKADPANRGRVMDTGLWRNSRHPNYFGEACTWWGIGLVAWTSAVTSVALIGPVVITFFLLKVSGVGMLEHHLRKTKPAYVDYVATTSSFLPLPKRAARPIDVATIPEARP